MLPQPLKPVCDLQPTEDSLRPGRGVSWFLSTSSNPNRSQLTPQWAPSWSPVSWQPHSLDLCWAYSHSGQLPFLPEGVECPGTRDSSHLSLLPLLTYLYFSPSSLLSPFFVFSLQSLLFPFLTFSIVWNPGSLTAPGTNKQTTTGTRGNG